MIGLQIDTKNCPDNRFSKIQSELTDIKSETYRLNSPSIITLWYISEIGSSGPRA